MTMHPTRTSEREPSKPPRQALSRILPELLPRLPIALLIGLLGTGLGCKSESSKGDTSGQGAAKGNTSKSTDQTPPKPSARDKGVAWRPLTDEARRAELGIGGLVIDFGTADQHKYTRGGWRTGWGENKEDQGTSFNQVGDAKAELDVVVDAKVAEVAVRARSSVGKQSLRVYVGNTQLDSQEIGPEWSVVRMPVKDGTMDAGRHTITLRLTQAGEPRAEFDWIWFAENAGAEPPTIGPRVLPIRIGDKPKRALVAPTPRTFHFYLQPAADSSLVFDYGSDVGATFTVSAQSDGTEESELFSAKGDKTWQEADISLSSFAGKATRLTLKTDGTDGVTGWGEPVILRSEKAQPKRKTISKRPKNVIVILIDTVRADAFKSFDPKSPVKTPSFDALAAKSTVFTAAYNQENWTKPSVATTLSGVYPSTHQTKRDDSTVPEDLTILPQHLKDNGFMTAGFVANGYVSRKFGFDKGWDHFTNYIRENKSSEAEHVYGDALEWLKKQQQQDAPFFLYIQTIDPHVIYKADKQYTDLYFNGDYDGWLGPNVQAEEQVAMSKGERKPTERDLEWLRALYYAEVTYHDEHMGKFLAEVEAMGLSDDTLVVVTNDHGEELGERGNFGHGHSLYQELVQAPMLMHYPPIFDAGGRVDEVVENVDMVPTILDVLQVEPMKGLDGQSILPLVTGEPMARPFYAITEFLDGRRATRVGNYAFMRSSGTWIHLFDMSQDPKQQKELIETHLIARRMAEVHLGEGLATPEKGKRQLDMSSRRQLTAGKADISPEVRRQLEALGYFGDTNDGSEDDTQN